LANSPNRCSRLEVGEGFEKVACLLGHATEVENFGNGCGGWSGVDIAPLFPFTWVLKEAGNHVLGIIGTRSKGLLFREDRMAGFYDELTIMTDDISKDRKGLDTKPLKDMLEKTKVDRVWANGPGIMMKFCAAPHQTLQCFHYCFSQYDYDRWHGNMRRLPCGDQRST
jgi:NAD(P)H-flavin reductase